MKLNWPFVIASILLIILGLSYWYRTTLIRQAFVPNQPIQKQALLPTGQDMTKPDIEVIADNLEIPWEIAFLPDDSLLVTERPGQLLKISSDKSIIPIEGVLHKGEGGLLGLALHPDFAQNHLLYLYSTTQVNGKPTNRVERYRLNGDTLTDREVIIDNIPGSTYHDGGRIAFGPDGMLYITTGDAGVSSNAQNKESLAGKILRLTDSGAIPPDNPFGSPVYSYGHRNPQGLAWDKRGDLWATEHGRSGATSGLDEVNLITPGSNYGWPTIQGDQAQSGLVTPKANSGATTTWAPSGATFLGSNLLFAGLRGQSIYVAQMTGTNITKITPYFTGQFGRLRTITVGPDGYLYILTNNRDGRGTPKQDDDKIIRLNPVLLQLTES